MPILYDPYTNQPVFVSESGVRDLLMQGYLSAPKQPRFAATTPTVAKRSEEVPAPVAVTPPSDPSSKASAQEPKEESAKPEDSKTETSKVETPAVEAPKVEVKTDIPPIAPPPAPTPVPVSEVVANATRLTGSLNINTAKLSDLAGLPGVGTAHARKIQQEAKKARFTSVEDLIARVSEVNWLSLTHLICVTDADASAPNMGSH